MGISKQNARVVGGAVLSAVAFAYFYLDLSVEDFYLSRSGWSFGGILFIVLIAVTIGVSYAAQVVQSSEGSDGDWDGRKSAFPDEFPALGAVRFSSSGTVKTGFDTIEEIRLQLPIPVLISVLDEGLVLSKTKQLTSKKEIVCIPWERLRAIEILKPKHLKGVKSAEDVARLNENLQAVLTVSRRDFPPFLMQVPWQRRFAEALPSTIELNQYWEVEDA